MLRLSAYVTRLTRLGPVGWCVISLGWEKPKRAVLTPADESTPMKAHFAWCKSKARCQTCLKKTGRQRFCTVRLGSTLYSRQAAAFAGAHPCVCWCLKPQSILLKSTHSCLTMRQSSNVLVNKNHTHLHPHPRPLWYYSPLFFLSALKP